MNTNLEKHFIYSGNRSRSIVLYDKILVSLTYNSNAKLNEIIIRFFIDCNMRSTRCKGRFSLVHKHKHKNFELFEL